MSASGHLLREGLRSLCGGSRPPFLNLPFFLSPLSPPPPRQPSLSAFGYLFSEMVQYAQTRVRTGAELERKWAPHPPLPLPC